MRTVIPIRAILLLLWTWAMCSPLAVAEDVVLGDSRDQVIATLGLPRGQFVYDDTEMLFYDRGRVELKDGLVLEVRLVSEEEVARLNRERELAEEEAHRAYLERLMRNRAEGLAVKQQMLTRPSYVQASPLERVEKWKDFMARYPQVDVQAEVETALRDLDLDTAVRTAEATQRRVARLENRLAEAEDRAVRAEDEARRSRETRNNSVYLGYGYGYPSPTYTTYRPYRPAAAYCRPVTKPVRPVRSVCRTSSARGWADPATNYRARPVRSTRSYSSCATRAPYTTRRSGLHGRVSVSF